MKSCRRRNPDSVRNSSSKFVIPTHFILKFSVVYWKGRSQYLSPTKEKIKTKPGDNQRTNQSTSVSFSRNTGKKVILTKNLYSPSVEIVGCHWKWQLCSASLHSLSVTTPQASLHLLLCWLMAISNVMSLSNNFLPSHFSLSSTIKSSMELSVQRFSCTIPIDTIWGEKSKLESKPNPHYIHIFFWHL